MNDLIKFGCLFTLVSPIIIGALFLVAAFFGWVFS
jgi:hypothetical protein